MSIYFCNDCKEAFLPEKTTTDGRQLFCNKCNVPLINLGSEHGKISLQAHIESQQRVSSDDLYHQFSLIQAKHYKTPKKDTILIDCEAKLAINPLNTEALFTLAQWYYAQGLSAEALAIAKQIISIDPSFNQAHDLISKTERNAFNKPTSLPDDVPTLESMALNFVKTKQFEQAEPILKKILSQDGKHVAARRYLADIYTEKGLFNEAIHQLNRLAMQYPDDDRILFNLAVACYNAKDMPRAMSNLKAAYKLTKDDDLREEIRQFMAHLDQFDG